MHFRDSPRLYCEAPSSHVPLNEEQARLDRRREKGKQHLA